MSAQISIRIRRLAMPIFVAAAATALIAASNAAAAGDPVKTGKVSFNVTKGFRKALKRNHVKMGPRKFGIRPGPSSIDPSTGTGSVRLKGSLKFRGHGHRLVAHRLTAKIGVKGGNLKGRIGGRNLTLLRLRSKPGGAKVDRIGFGARLSRISARLGKHLARTVNRKLGLHSLVTSRRLAKVTLTEQPKTVAITGGFVYLDVPDGYLPANPAVPGSGADPNTVAAKQPSHCIDPAFGVDVIAGDPNNPARITRAAPFTADPVLGPPPAGDAARFRFPVSSGTVSPAGTDGVIQVSGGVRLMSGGHGSVDALDGFTQPSPCLAPGPSPSASPGVLDTTNLAPNLGLMNVQAQTVIGGTNPGAPNTGCPNAAPPPGPCVFPGDKGIAIGQTIDSSGVAVNADPNAKTVTIAGGVIRNNDLATGVLNQLFPNKSGNTGLDFASGDKFGVSTLAVNTR